MRRKAPHPNPLPASGAREKDRKSLAAINPKRHLPRADGLLAIGQMYRAIAAGRMCRNIGGCDIVRSHGPSRRLRRHCLDDASILRLTILRWNVIQHRRQPALGLGDGPALAPGVIFDLVTLDLAD